MTKKKVIPVEFGVEIKEESNQFLLATVMVYGQSIMHFKPSPKITPKEFSHGPVFVSDTATGGKQISLFYISDRAGLKNIVTGIALIGDTLYIQIISNDKRKAMQVSCKATRSCIQFYNKNN